ncbi:MAG: Ig-like domain-containing protein [Gemmatimonadales bacterium]
MVRAGGVVAVLVAAFTTCRDALGPREGALARVAVAPIFPSGAAMADFGLTIDRIRIIVVRPVADTIADTTAALPPDADFLDLDLRVPLLAARESLSVTIEALAGSIPLFSGTSLVEVRAGVSAPPPTEIPVTTYVGPGAGVDSILVQPAAPFVYLNDSLRFQVQAFQNGEPVTQFYVSWSTSDAGVAPINGFGVLRAPSARTSVLVRARTPSGAADSAPVTFVPLPSQLVVVAGAGQSGTVGQVLEVPLEVEVRGSDNLPVGGVAVRFRALSGGTPADTTVTSDAAGRARVFAVLGPVAGAQSFDAALPAFPSVPAVTFTATATASTIASVVVTPATALLDALGATRQFSAEAFDGNGNPVATTFTWTSSDPLVASVDGTGLATALANGAVTIAASSGGVSDSADLTVQQVVDSVVLTPSSALLTAIGDTQRFTAAARDSLGSAVAGAVFTWATTDPLVGLVDTAGLVTAVAEGTTDVTATTAGVQGRAPVTVSLLATATRLVFVQQPPSPVFFGDTFTVQVAAQDDLGNTITSFTGNVFLSENAGSSNTISKLGGTLTQAAVNGVATFTDLFVDGTDTTAIDAIADGLASATSSTVAVVDQIVLQETGAAPYFAGVDTVTNRVYVSNTSGSSATVLDGTSHKVAGAVTGLGPNPGWEGVNPVTKRVFISDFLDGLVYIIDESQDVVEGTISVGPNATQPAVDPATDIIYVPARPRELMLRTVDTRTREVIGDVVIGGTSDNAGGAVWDLRTKLVWVVIETQSSIKSVDPAQGRVMDSIFVGEGPYGIALDPVLNRLYVSLSGQSQVFVLDLVEKVALQPINVGAFPQGLSVDAETGRVFVANYDDGVRQGTISVIDGARGEVIKTITVGVGPGDAEYNPRNRLVYVPNGSDNSLSIVKP